MPDEDTQAHSEPPTVLEYRQLEKPRNGAAVAAFLLGFVLSIAAVAAIGVGVFLQTHPYFPYAPPPPTKPNWAPLLIFFAVTVSTLALSVHVWRARPRGRWFWLGLLIGTGLVGLLEGACNGSP